MGKVIRNFCWHQNLVPKRLSVPGLGLYTCIKSFKRDCFKTCYWSSGWLRFWERIPYESKDSPGWISYCIEYEKLCDFILSMSCLLTKPTKWHVRPAKTQISLGIRPVWSVFPVCSVGSLGPKRSGGQQRLWLNWADAQADLSLCWAHRSFCWFCHETARGFSDHQVCDYLCIKL